MNEYSEDYLAHYGVLGMKWGVRHDPKKAYQKAKNKLDKLESKAEKKQAKASKYRTKARESRYGITDIGRTVWKNRQIKAGKLQRSADRATRRGEKWLKEMKDTFADVKLDDLDDVDISILKEN